MIGELALLSFCDRCPRGAIPAEDFVDGFGCGRFLAGHAPVRFDTSEIERNARDFFG
jgi:hypothetical protein